MQSILFRHNCQDIKNEEMAPPDFFVDLNLDQVIEWITKLKQDYNLKPFFSVSLSKVEDVEYRQSVFRDLENPHLLKAIKTFANEMVMVGRYLDLTKNSYYNYHRQGWLLEAANVYCDAVKNLGDELNALEVNSTALMTFFHNLTNYLNSTGFLKLSVDTTALKKELSSMKFNIVIKNSLVRVGKFEGEIDYSTEVQRTFEKFKQKDAKNYRIDLLETTGMNHVTDQILKCVSKLYPEIFLSLNNFYHSYNQFVDKDIKNFDREIQFYVAYLDFIEKFKAQKLNFCYPVVSVDKNVFANDAFDIALANICYFEASTVVCNDFYLEDQERVIVVSGPNQGGKTTFARMFGQLHYLASLGCPVPGKAAKLFLFDQLFTHFEKEEDIRKLRGKLKDELIRIFTIFERTTPNSIIIMNEIFTSTTLQDAIYLSNKIFQKILEKDVLCVCVSFIDELSTLSEKTVSMVSTVVPENPAQRTYKIVRKKSDGLSYAISIAEKHSLTYNRIKDRITS